MIARRARPRRGGAARRARSRSRRPTRTSTPRSSAASPRSRARPAPSCTPAAAATTRSRSTCACTCGARAASRSRRIHELQQVLLRRADEADRRRTLPGLHAPAARAAGAARAPSARALLGARRATSTAGATASRAPTSRRSARARSPARACRSIPTSSPTSSASPRRFENSLDAVSDRDFVAEALFVATLTQVHLSRHRRGDRAVVDRGVRLRAARRRVLDRLVDAAAEEEPRHRRAGARQGRAG